MKHSTAKSFFYAFEGLKTAYKKEPNLKIHTFFAILALLSGLILGLTAIEWMMLVFTIFYVITLELLNTVLEAVVDLVSPEIKDTAKIAKDVAAAGVLTAAVLSIIVGITLFLPKIIALL